MKTRSIYRIGTGVKEAGERMAHVKVAGFPALRWCCDLVISIGGSILGFALRQPIG